ncbi:MFS transporter [uncultured Microbacterium sp.]|uniref:MFS transporter n=1 Tax=uncultured Microbacterium sp. TaxID=191216 RepID=UPI0025DD4192|nr:MFS transporter [uncultured Microbacterium sp.]
MTAAVGNARPLWRGRVLAILGIVLCAFSLRSAVASLSPVVSLVAKEFPLDPAIIGLIGTAPPVCFAVFGLVTPLVERRLGLERVAVIALIAVTLGLVGRGFSVNAVTLVGATALVFAGVGMANILMPPLVKKYFPDRLGLMMTVYTTVMAFSTFLPPLVALPLAETAGWRTSLALWAVFALAGLIPWVAMILRERGSAVVPEPVDPDPAPAHERRTARDGSTVDLSLEDAIAAATGPIGVAPAGGRIFARLSRIPLAWALAAVFGTSSTMAYVSFAWLPTVLVQYEGVSPQAAGALLSLFAFIGLPASLVVPLLVVRFRATTPLYLVGAIGGVAGLIGLVLFPSPTWAALWVSLFGLVGLLFPLALVLISVRAREAETAVALSGFVQSFGYVMAAVFPVLFGVLHGASGGWVVPLWVLAAVLVLSIPAGVAVGRAHTVEAAWERRNGRLW